MDWKTEHRIRTAGPWAIFGVTVLVSWALYTQSVSPGQAMGFAEGEEISIGSTHTGRVAQISVQPGQSVSAGQIVAMLDTQAIDAQITVLKAEIEARRAGGETTLVRDTAELDSAVQEAEIAVAREEASLLSSQAELKVLAAERDRLRNLVQQNLATGEDLAALDMRYVTLEREVQERPTTLRLLRTQLSKTKSRAATRQAGSEDPLATALARELEVSAKKLELLEMQREALMLRAPIAGTVTMVHGLVGEVVTPGDPVIGLVGSQSSRVIACLSEDDALSVERGDKASLWIRGRENRKLSGNVVALGPLVDEVPLRCRKIPNRPAWGRHVTILLDNQVTLIPGQSLSVKFDLGSSTGVAQAQGLRATSSKDITPIDVPNDLQKLSRFEPSGLIWQARAARYLVVSDDTGLKNKREHSPWLFSMSADGSIDPQPIPIQKSGPLKDLESITSDADGALYLLSSQSYSRKGKRSVERTQFLKVAPGPHTYDMVASQSLAQELDAQTPEFLEALGLKDGTRDLEIEAMSHWQGSLYLGLKSPLSPSGHAIIWKLDSPDAFLQSGDIAQAGLSLWAQVKVPARIDGQAVPAGLSELLFLPNGSLLLSSTPSVGDSGSPTGALSYIANPHSGLMQVTTLQEFDGRKPEGLSLSAKPGHIVVAFDAGDQTPEWIELPWPK